MKPAKIVEAKVIFVLALLGVISLLACCPKPQIEVTPGEEAAKVIETIMVPQTPLWGLVLVDDAMWTVDTKARALKKIDMAQKRVVSTVPMEIREPRGLTWDGTAFWIVDNSTKMVHRFDLRSRSVVRSLKVPLQRGDEEAVIETTAWDGKHLWVAYFAGWSSRILCLDIETGEVLMSMFANGHPRALATDGKRLWMVSYNGSKYTGAITVRTIMDDAGKMNLTQTFVGRTGGKEPVGMTFDGTHLWVADRALKAIQKIAVP